MLLLKKFISTLVNKEPTLTVTRDPKWSNVRNQFLKENGSKCACCLKTKKLNVHHIIPVHVDSSLELEHSNLIILCENKTLNCHLSIGHLQNYKAYNPDVREDAMFWNNRIKNRKYRNITQ